MVERNTMINEPAAQAGAGAAAMRVDVPATGTPAPQGAGAEQGGYVMFMIVKRKAFDSTVTESCVAIYSHNPSTIHAFRKLISRRPLSWKEISYYAYRRKVNIAILTYTTRSTNTAILAALQRAGIPLEKALPLGEVLPRLPEWLKQGLRWVQWVPAPRRSDAVKLVSSPLDWPFNPARAASEVVPLDLFREAVLYKFKKRVVISFEKYGKAISIDLTYTPEELFYSAISSLPEEAIDLLLKWREEISEEVPELEPFFSLLTLVR